MIALIIPLALVVFCSVSMVADLRTLDKQIKQNDKELKNGV